MTIILFAIGILPLGADEINSSLQVETLIPLAQDREYHSLSAESIRHSAATFLGSRPEASGVIIRYRLDCSSRIPTESLVFQTGRISELEGLEYYSISKKRTRLLFESIYRVENPSADPAGRRFEFESLIRVTDPASADERTLPENSIFYQNDTSFGESLWQVRTEPTGQGLILLFKNLSPLKKAGIRVTDPHGMKMVFILTPEEDHLMLEAVISADIRPMPLLEERIKGSLANRLNAVSARLIELISGQETPLPEIQDCQ